MFIPDSALAVYPAWANRDTDVRPVYMKDPFPRRLMTFKIVKRLQTVVTLQQGFTGSTAKCANQPGIA
jgi:hypothetical protein